MANGNTLLNYEVALEMKWFTQALANQFTNYAAACEFYKTLLHFKGIEESKWPNQPLFKDRDNAGNLEKAEKYFFALQNLYAREARVRIDLIRASYGNDNDIPDILETRTVNEIKV